METVVQPPPEAELHLLTDWSDPSGRARMGRSAVLSLLTHAAAIVFLLFMPETFMQPKYHEAPEAVVTPLVMPPLTVTQREPNPTKTIRELRSPDLSPRLPLPPGPSPTPQMPAPRKAQVPPAPPPPPRTSPQPPLPEPPKVDIASTEPPKLTIPVTPPQGPPSKGPFEDVQPFTPVPPDKRVVDLTSPSITGGIRGGALRGPGINTSGIAPIPSSGAALPQLLSDPGGVEWAPYLSHVLDAVQAYWHKIMPADKRRGSVTVQFAIRRDGTVRTAAFSHQTGFTPLDNAALEAISGGGPFGPLPAQYKGTEIHVEMNFMYNVPKR